MSDLSFHWTGWDPDAFFDWAGRAATELIIQPVADAAADPLKKVLCWGALLLLVVLVIR